MNGKSEGHMASNSFLKKDWKQNIDLVNASHSEKVKVVHDVTQLLLVFIEDTK